MSEIEKTENSTQPMTKEGLSRQIAILKREGAPAKREAERSDAFLAIEAVGMAVLFPFALLTGCSASDVGNNGHTSLMMAVSVLDEEWVKKMIANGADVNLQDNDGKTALMETAQSAGTESLLSSAYSKDYSEALRRQDGSARRFMGRLHPFEARIRIAKMLIAAGADINARNNEGKNALDMTHDATDVGKYKNAEVEQLLVEEIEKSKTKQ